MIKTNLTVHSSNEKAVSFFKVVLELSYGGRKMTNLKVYDFVKDVFTFDVHNR